MNTNQTHEQLKSKALIETNIAYLLIDVANTFLKNADEKLNVVGKELKLDEKHAFNRVKKESQKLITLTKLISTPIYKLKQVDEACEDSDWLYDYIRLLVDRTADDKELMDKAKEYLKSIDSKLNFY